MSKVLHRASAASSTTQAKSAPTALIVGASLAGLMTALALAREGWAVTMLERTRGKHRTGAALSAPERMLEQLTGRRSGVSAPPLPSGVQTWNAIHDGLRAAVDAEPRIDVVQGAVVIDAGQTQTATWARTDDGLVRVADILVGADGHRSLIRGRVAPDKPNATFAGYVIWLGLIDEREVNGPWPTDVAYLEAEDYCFLGYPLPPPTKSVSGNDRRLGWAWYDASHNDLLRSSGAVNDDVVQRKMTRNDIPDGVYAELARQAERLWPRLWADAVKTCVDRRSIIGTPIGEYVPNRMVSGRLCLVGDAAHVPTPMTAMGVRSSLADALALADALSERARSDSEIVGALRCFEASRLAAGQAIVESGQQFSREFVTSAERVRRELALRKLDQLP